MSGAYELWPLLLGHQKVTMGDEMALASAVAVIGGADPDDPLETENRVRHVTVGVVILLIATWAFVATTLAFHSNLRAPWPMAAIGGFLIASVVASIDTLITVTPFKDDKVRSKLVLIGARGALSLAMGLVISHATILFIYRDDLSRDVSQINNADVAQITKNTIASSSQTLIINNANSATATDNNNIKDANGALKTVEAEERRRRDLWQADTVCIHGQLAANGDLCGAGPESQKLYNNWIAYRDNDLAKAQSDHNAAVSAAQEDIKQQNAVVTAATANRNAEIAHAIENVKDSMGLQAQNNALWKILKHDWMAWLWPIFFIIVDLVVALLKGLLGESDFDRRRRLNRKLRDQLASALTIPVPVGASPELAELHQFAAAQQAQIERARIDRATRRRLESLGKAPGPSASRRGIASAAVALVLLAGAGLLVSQHSRSPTTTITGPMAAGASTAGGRLVPVAPTEPHSVPPDASKAMWCTKVASDADLHSLATDLPSLITESGAAANKAKQRVLAAAATLTSTAGEAEAKTASLMRSAANTLAIAASAPTSIHLSAAGDALTALGQKAQTQCHFS